MSLLPDAYAAFLSNTKKSNSLLNSFGSNSATYGIHLPPNLRNNLLHDQQRFMPCLMSSVACNDGRVLVPRVTESDSSPNDDNIQKFSIFHRTFRPMSLSSRQASPIVVIHGGPGIPSDYLFPLVDVVPYRSIVFYDQLGCGRSDSPQDPSLYSIEKSLDDFEILIKKLGLRQFHLYGQSFGGILAYEFVKRMTERNIDEYKCLSVILSGTPTSVPLVEKEANRLLELIKDEYVNNDEMEDDDDKSNEAAISAAIGELFRQKHQCRTPEMPIPLQDAYAHAGKPGVWRGTASIQNYIANPPSMNQEEKESKKLKRMPSCMVLRGEYDFVSDSCTENWKTGGLFNHKFVRERVVSNSSHHILLENGKEYGELIDSFCSEYD